MVPVRSLAICLDTIVEKIRNARDSYRQMVRAACETLGQLAPRIIVRAYRTVRYAFWTDGTIVLPADREEYWQQALYLLAQHLRSWWQQESDIFLPFSLQVFADEAYLWHRLFVLKLQKAA